MESITKLIFKRKLKWWNYLLFSMNFLVFGISLWALNGVGLFVCVMMGLGLLNFLYSIKSLKGNKKVSKFRVLPNRSLKGSA